MTGAVRTLMIWYATRVYVTISVNAPMQFSKEQLNMLSFAFFVSRCSSNTRTILDKHVILSNLLHTVDSQGVSLTTFLYKWSFLTKFVVYFSFWNLLFVNDISCTIMRIAIIGAGASGLPAARIALEYGNEPMVFEKSTDIGGLWRYRDDGTDGFFHTKLYTSSSRFVL